MPQMAPMLWFFLFIYFSVLISSWAIKLHFNV